MKKIWLFVVALAVGAAAISYAADAKGGKSAAELEKEKALAHPYPNDLGPDKLDAAYVASMPADKKKGYETLLARCAQCHSAARPLNSRFVEPSGKDAAVAKLKS